MKFLQHAPKISRPISIAPDPILPLSIACRYLPDLYLEKTGFRVLLDVDVDGKVSVDVAHLVFETFRDPDDEVVDDCLDGSEGSDVLARAVVELNVDDVLGSMRERDGKMRHILDQLP